MKFPQIGPAFLVTAAFIGPGTVITASLAGANYGFALVWALLFSVIATIILQEMTARLGIVTQQGLGENIVGELINKNGVIPYHTCYSVDDLNESVKLLTTKNFRQISKKIKAKAFNNSLIQFLYNPNAGIIELLEIEK